MNMLITPGKLFFQISKVLFRPKIYLYKQKGDREKEKLLTETSKGDK